MLSTHVKFIFKLHLTSEPYRFSEIFLKLQKNWKNNVFMNCGKNVQHQK